MRLVRARALVAIVVWLALETTGRPAAKDLTPAAIEGFDRYVRAVESRLASSPHVLAIDELPDNERARQYRELMSGAVLVRKGEPAGALEGEAAAAAMIHHWRGTVLLPGVAIDRAIRAVQDYDGYARRFDPLIMRSRLINREGNRFDVEIRLKAKSIVTVVLDSSYTIEYRHLDANRVRTRSVSTGISEVHDAGKPGERSVPSERGTGYLWRLNTYCSFEGRPEGTYEQCESVSLTRTPPRLLAWVVRPIMNGLPREALEFTLSRTRSALQQ